MELISAVTVGAGGTNNITFSSIPATYTDLTLIISGRTATAIIQDAMKIQLNGDTGSNYSTRNLYSDTTSSVSSTTYSSIGFFLNVGWFPAASNTASVFGNFRVLFPNYAGSTVKTATFEATSETAGATYTGGLAIAGGLWNSTAAITSIKIFGDYGQNLIQYSTAYLYGTLKGSGGASVTSA
jgi:hypothetical protein